MNELERQVVDALRKRGDSVETVGRPEIEFARRLARRAPAPRRRARPPRLVLAALAAVVIAIPVLLVGWIASDRPGGRPPGPTSLSTERPLSAEDVQERFTLHLDPTTLITGEGAAWVVDRHGALDRIDESSGAATVRTGIPGWSATARIAAGLGAVWVGVPDDHSVLQLDPVSAAVRQRVPVSTAGAITAGHLGVWAQTAPRVISRLDPSTAHVVHAVTLPVIPTDLVEGSDALWAVGGSALVRIAVGSDNVQEIPLDRPALAVAATNRSVWVLTGRALIEYDLAGNEIDRRALTGGTRLAADHIAGHVVVATKAGALSSVAERSGIRARTVRVADAPVGGLAVGSGSVWVASHHELLRLADASP